MIDPHRLVILRAVIAAGSIQAAARNLAFSPATISQHLQALARQTGLTLFEKRGRGIVPTAAGRHLAEESGEPLAHLERLDRIVADLREGRADRLAIACFASVAQRWIPHVATALRRASPSVVLEVSLNEPHDGHGRRRPDIAIHNEPVDGLPRQFEGYDRHVLTDEPFLAVLPDGHPLTARKTIAMAELRDEPWIDHDIYDSPTGQILISACRAAGFSPRYVARLDDHHAATALVAAGLGITVLPRVALTGLPEGLTVRPVTNPPVRRRIVAHVRTSAGRSRLVDLALTELRAEAGSDAG